MKTVRLTRHDTGTNFALNPDNVITVGPVSSNGAIVVGASWLILLNSGSVAVAGAPEDVAKELGDDFVPVSSAGTHVNRRHVVAVDGAYDEKGRTILGAAVIVVLGAPEPLIVQGSVGDIAQAFESGGAARRRQNSLVIQ